MSEQPLRPSRLGAATVVGLLGLALGISAAFRSSETPIRGSDARVIGERLLGNGAGSGDNGNGKNNGGGNDKKDFTIAGQVGDLYPGATRPLVLTLTNANNFPIRVTALNVAVPNLSGCASSNLQISSYASGSAVIPSNGTTTTTLNVHMVGNPPDACESRSFGLTYSGTAVKL